MTPGRDRWAEAAGGRGVGSLLASRVAQAWGVQYPCLGDHSEMVARSGLGCKLAKSLHGVRGACLGPTTAGCLHTCPQQPRGQNYRELLGTASAAGSVPPLLSADQTLCSLQRGNALQSSKERVDCDIRSKTSTTGTVLENLLRYN